MATPPSRPPACARWRDRAAHGKDWHRLKFQSCRSLRSHRREHDRAARVHRDAGRQTYGEGKLRHMVPRGLQGRWRAKIGARVAEGRRDKSCEQRRWLEGRQDGVPLYPRSRQSAARAAGYRQIVPRRKRERNPAPRVQGAGDNRGRRGVIWWATVLDSPGCRVGYSPRASRQSVPCTLS